MVASQSGVGKVSQGILLHPAWKHNAKKVAGFTSSLGPAKTLGKEACRPEISGKVVLHFFSDGLQGERHGGMAGNLGLTHFHGFLVPAFPFNSCIFGYNASRTSGMVWEDDTLPTDKYEFSVELPSQPPSEWSCVDDDDAGELLKWAYNAKVLKTSDEMVCFREELRYVVSWSEASVDKGWELQVGGFDVRLQQPVSFKFRAKGGKKRKFDVSAKEK